MNILLPELKFRLLLHSKGGIPIYYSGSHWLRNVMGAPRKFQTILHDEKYN